MKSTLQYVYSISVFLGVLATSYLLMSREGNVRNNLAGASSTQYRVEANFLDPALTSLFEMENALANLPKPPQKNPKKPEPESIRIPSTQSVK